MHPNTVVLPLEDFCKWGEGSGSHQELKDFCTSLELKGEAGHLDGILKGLQGLGLEIVLFLKQDA